MLPSRIKESLICFLLLLEIFKSILLQGKYDFLAIEKFCTVHDLIILLSFGAQRNISLIFVKSVQRRRKASVVADTTWNKTIVQTFCLLPTTEMILDCNGNARAKLDTTALNL